MGQVGDTLSFGTRPQRGVGSTTAAYGDGFHAHEFVSPPCCLQPTFRVFVRDPIAALASVMLRPDVEPSLCRCGGLGWDHRGHAPQLGRCGHSPPTPCAHVVSTIDRYARFPGAMARCHDATLWLWPALDNWTTGSSFSFHIPKMKL